MKAKILSAVLLLAVLTTFSGLPMTMGERLSVADAMEKKPDVPKGIESQKGKGHLVVAYYFHSTFRCTTCFTMEQFTQEAITKGFPDELKDGRLVLKIVNVDEEGNEHFMNDYQLHTKSVVIVDVKDGKQLKWKNLKRIWNLVDNKEAFIKYIQEETRSYLGKT